MFNRRQFDRILFRVSCAITKQTKPLDFGCHMKSPHDRDFYSHSIFVYVPNLTSLLFFFLYSLLDFEIMRLALCLFFFTSRFLSFIIIFKYIGNYAVQIMAFACIIPALSLSLLLLLSFVSFVWFLIVVENTFWVLIKIKTSILLHIRWTKLVQKF